MAEMGSVFGRPGASPGLQASVMRSAVLNSSPAPAEPADIVEDKTLQEYYRLYMAVTEILKNEREKKRVDQLLQIKTFADETIRMKQGQDSSAGPPAPTPPPVAQAAGVPAPQAGGMPGAAPGPMPPGLPGGAPPPASPVAA